MSDLITLVNWLTFTNIDMAEETEVPATLSVVGRQADMIGSAEGFGDNDVDNMAFLMGYLAYPCDAAYMVACLPVWGVEVLDPANPPDVTRITTDDPQVVNSFLLWGHCVPTRETHVVMAVRSVLDDGSVQWVAVDPTNDVTAEWPEFEREAHAYDSYKVIDGEERGRELACDLILQSNGNGYVVTKFDSGQMMAAAKHWEQTNVLAHEAEAE